MTYFPAEMAIADGITALFLVLGAAFLLKFLLKIGSPRSKNYSLIMGLSIIAYAIFHEGTELLYGIYGTDAGLGGTIITLTISITYLIAALLLRNEIKSIITAGVRKHGG